MPLTAKQEARVDMLLPYFDEESLAAFAEEENSRNNPEDIVERILTEVTVYEKAGVRNQYTGTYRGHPFIIGEENRYVDDGFTLREMYIRTQYGAGRASKKMMVFMISGKVGGYPTDGLRFTDEFKGPLADVLQCLFEAAKTRYRDAEIERLMKADTNTPTPKDDGDFGLDSLIVTPPN